MSLSSHDADCIEQLATRVQRLLRLQLASLTSSYSNGSAAEGQAQKGQGAVRGAHGGRSSPKQR